MENCPECGKPLKYIKTVRSRQLKKRWDVFKCQNCSVEVREVKE